MTTLTTPAGPSEVITARRTESLDASCIQQLVQPATDSLFGRVNVVHLIEKAVLAVTLSNDREDVLGHAAFFDYPNIPGVDAANWEKWMSQYYDTTQCDALNSLFMHYFVAKSEYSHGCAKEIIRTMFNAVPDLHYCFLVVPTGVFPESSLAEIFKQVDKVSERGPDGCVIFCCHRHDHVPVLHIRSARVEDHDDLVPIFNRQSTMLKDTYGDYFLAELIESQDEEMKCVVAEVEGLAVGFMSVSSEVNAELLNECFELGPFHGLCQPHEQDEVESAKSPTPTPTPPETRAPRPSSARSEVSVASQASAAASPRSTSRQTSDLGKGDAVTSPTGRLSGSGTKTSRPASVSSAKGSVKAEEPRIRGKLSDGEETLMSDHSDVQSVHSEASHRNLADSHTPDVEEVFESMTPMPVTPQSKLPKRCVPKYHGPVSAFCIQLFCVDEQFEMRSCDFLPSVFDLFPDKEYCVITVPHMVPEFPLLQQFVRITPRVPSTLSQELYVFSRAGLLKDFRVRPACTSDLEGASTLVKTLEMSKNLIQDLKQFCKARRDDDGTELQAFVADCGGHVVGIAVVRREEDIEHIRSHYNIEDFIYFNHHRREEHGHLHHFTLNPLFKHYSKMFLKEVMRLGHKTCLYYPLYPSYVEPQVLSRHTLVTALTDLVPVRARRQITYPLEDLGDNAPSGRVLKQPEHFALNHINRKLTLEPKVTINARIVVVGASDVGVSFLETLAFCPHLRFNNLTVISPHGLPGELPADRLRDAMVTDSHCYSQEEYAKMALRSWVNVVYGLMTAIDRKKKHVVVNKNTLVPYDYLVLATGTQFQCPAPTGADISQLVTNNELPQRPDRHWLDQVPKNVFTVNDAYDAAVALYWVENNLLNASGPAVVYGNGMETYTCIQALLTMGLPGNRIILVQPPHNCQPSCFNNHDVQSAVEGALREAGVQVHSGYILAQWNDGNDAEEVTSASFTSSTKPMRLECRAFFAYYKKMVDPHAFKAINDACLVFDGRLVVDASFHTTDVVIRAAGPLTKFQRRYHADQWSHANFNSKEVGMQLAGAMLSLFDPTLEPPETEQAEDLLKLIPMYRSPKVIGASLPGGFQYLHVAKPGLCTPLDVLMAQNDYGREVVTGQPDGGDMHYFRLHVNQYNTVETITCLTSSPLPTTNLLCLYGLHERYLNSLLSRYDEGLIKDLYSYFRESWSLALFHDRFPDFRDEVRELLINRPAADLEALEERVRQLIDEDTALSKNQRADLADEYARSGAKRAVETRMLSFLSYNYYHLPMYAKPGMV